MMSPSSDNVMSDEFKYQIDKRVKEILDQAYDKVRMTLSKNKKLLDKLVEGLL